MSDPSRPHPPGSSPRHPSDPQELLRHAGWLRRLALALAPDPAGAEDLVQETYLAALAEGADSPGPQDTPRSRRAWLAQVARNLARQTYRKQAHRRQREARAASPEALPSAADLAAEIDAQTALSREVMGLPEPYRTVLLMRYYRELSPAEIAKRCGRPPGTVRSQLTRGVALLRERLEEREGGAQRFLCLAAGLGAPRLAPPATLALPTLPAIAMQTAAKLGIAATLTVLAVVGWRTLQDEAPAPQAQALEVQAAESAPEAPAPGPALLAEADTGPAKELREAAPKVARSEPAPEPIPAPLDSAPPASGFLEATFVDDTGIPQPKVQFSLRDGPWGRSVGAVATSDSAGQVRLEVPTSDPKILIQWRCEAFASGVLPTHIAPGETRSLGTIVLAGCAELAGLILDGDGQPVVGARVWADDRELTPGFGSPITGEPNDIDRGILERHGMSDLNSPEGFSAFAITDRFGVYRIAAVAVTKPQRVWAHKEDWRFSWTEPIVLGAGERRGGVDLTLAPLDDSDRIAGQIVDPDGKPVADAFLTYQIQSDGLGLSSSTRVDDEGRFNLVVWRKVPHQLTATAAEGDLSAASLPSVQPGSVDLVLRLGSQDEGVQLFVKDEGGQPITRYEVLLVQSSESGTFGRYQPGEVHENGRALLHAPAATFEIAVTAKGYREAEAGPFEEGIVPGNRIELTLQAVPGISGVVLAGGKPIEGASVSLHRSTEGRERMEINGFPTRVDTGTAAQLTDGEGRFLVFPSSSGTYVVSAHKEGWGRVELDPIWISDSEPSENHRLTLPRPGSLRIQVIREDGSDPGGTLLAINRYDGHPSTHVADSAGVVVVEGLTPGGWAVTPAEREIGPFTSSSRSWQADEAETTAWPVHCQVQPGQQTNHELRIEAD